MALGAEVRLTRSDVPKGHPEYYQDMAERIVKETPGAFWASQFDNPANPLAHETGTGPEIWAQMDGQVDAVVCGVGSGGTITGIGLGMVAPTILAHATEEVEDLYLAKMYRGDLVGAQLFSEPGAGSDLAAVRTRATCCAYDCVLPCGAATHLRRRAHKASVLMCACMPSTLSMLHT